MYYAHVILADDLYLADETLEAGDNVMLRTAEPDRDEARGMIASYGDIVRMSTHPVDVVGATQCVDWLDI